MPNLIAVLVSAVISMIVGSFWYSVLFGKTWMKLSGITEKQIKEAKKKGMTKSYVIMFISLLVMFYILGIFIEYSGASTAVQGSMIGFLIWLGFLATTMLSSVLWDNKPVKLYWINTLHYLVVLVIAGAILAVWV